MRSRSPHPKHQTNVTPLQNKGNVELRPDLWDDRYSEKEREKLMVVAQQFGLDPMTNEVMILKGKVYVTASGLQKLALLDPDYDGCEIELIETDWANNFFVIKARVWKKGCSHPFEDYGDADPTTSNMRGHALFRHAITRARARAMRSAFAIPFCSLEELDDDSRRKEQEPNRRAPVVVEKKEEPKKATASAESFVTEQQLAMLSRYCKDLGWSEEKLEEHLYEQYELEEKMALTRAQASQLLDQLSTQLKEQKEALAAKAEAEKAEKAKKEAAEKAAEAAEKAAEAAEKAAAEKAQKAEEKAAAEAEQANSEKKKPANGVKRPAKASVQEDDGFEAPKSKRNGNSGAKRSQPRPSMLPRWTPEEQRRIADDLVQRMQGAKTMKELRREWELFQGVRHQLSEEWFSQICETKEQRKAVLAAA